MLSGTGYPSGENYPAGTGMELFFYLHAGTGNPTGKILRVQIRMSTTRRVRTRCHLELRRVALIVRALVDRIVRGCGQGKLEAGTRRAGEGEPCALWKGCGELLLSYGLLWTASYGWEAVSGCAAGPNVQAVPPFEERLSSVSQVRLPMEVEIEPDRPCRLRPRAVTRPECLLEHTTPLHWQKGVVAFHDLRAPFGSPVMAFLKSTRETMSLLLPRNVEEPWVPPIPPHGRNSNGNIASMPTHQARTCEHINYAC
jgi:hypothetical protein